MQTRVWLYGMPRERLATWGNAKQATHTARHVWDAAVRGGWGVRTSVLSQLTTESQENQWIDTDA